MEQFDKESTLRRIQKMMAIAADDRANPAEAANAASMAEKLMRKYQIDHAELVKEDLRKGKNFSTRDCMASAKTNGTLIKQVPPWASMMALRVAQFNDCGATTSKRPDTGEACVRFYGYDSDVQVCAWMFDYLVATTLRLSKEFFKVEKDKAALFAYRRGVSMGIIGSLVALTKEKADEMQATVTARDLVVIKGVALTEHFGAHIFAVKKGSAGGVKNVDAFSRGVVDGAQVDVKRRGIEGAQDNQLKLEV